MALFCGVQSNSGSGKSDTGSGIRPLPYVSDYVVSKEYFEF